MNNTVLRGPSHRGTMPTRRIYYFDWLRAIAVFGVVAYHTVLPFSRDTRRRKWSRLFKLPTLLNVVLGKKSPEELVKCFAKRVCSWMFCPQ